MMTKNIVNTKSYEELYCSRVKKQLIEEAIQKTVEECSMSNQGTERRNPFNDHLVCEHLAEIMIEKYPGKNLDYHSQRMNLETTKKMLEAINAYFYTDLSFDGMLRVSI